MTDDELSKLADTIAEHSIAHDKLQSVQVYIQRGRSLEGLSPDVLKNGLVLAVNEWADELDNIAKLMVFEEFCCEMSLLGIPEPIEEVRSALDKIAARVTEMHNDPEASAGVTRAALESYRTSLLSRQ